MNTQEVADAFTALCKAGKLDEAGERFWSPDVVSLEPGDGPMARAEGAAALKAKGDWWTASHEIHAFTTDGPQVNGEQFVLRFGMDVTPKGASASRSTRPPSTPSATARSSRNASSTEPRR